MFLKCDFLKGDLFYQPVVSQVEFAPGETLKCFVKLAINQSCEVCGKRADFFIRTSLAHLYPSVRGSELNRSDWVLRRKIGLAS